MGKYLKNFNTHSEYLAFTQTSDFILPNVSHCVEQNEVHYNPWTWADEYFTTVARENGAISFNIQQSMGTSMIKSISYSTDNGETWTTTNNTDDKTASLAIDVNVNEGDKVLWKGDATQLGFFDDIDGDVVGSFFSSDCEFDAQGNVMSLLYGDDFNGETTIENEYAFACLFYDYYSREKACKMVNAKNLSLPATTLAEICYASMFAGCTSLTTAPELPATTLASYCYESMFNGCTSLTTAPELPATTLASSCYGSMFQACTSLTTAPELPATTLTKYCYASMFNGCTNLTTAPELLATTLANSCYYGMFNGCTNLTTAPELLATTLANSCYESMFNGCTNLNYIKAMFTTTPSTTYTNKWVNGVASSGTFVKNSAAKWNVTGVNGIPSGWTVQTATA